MAQTELLAHSARFGCPEQSYREHISEVVRRAVQNATGAAPYSPHGNLLVTTVHAAGIYHDLGKLDDANQKVLRGKKKTHLPINHCDAGAAYLLKMKAILPALCVLSHHRPGLPSIPDENSKVQKFRMRSHVNNRGKSVQEITDENLDYYIKSHNAEMSLTSDYPDKTAPGQSFLRFALSCLVDADHADTARHYGNKAKIEAIELLPEHRIARLDAYVNSLLTGNATVERNEIRKTFYQTCREIPRERGLYSCSMPVGTGKTTSVMANLLMAAHRFKLRKIFVVLPFTNIIDQSVSTYRKSLFINDEKPDAVVAAHHHRAEYEDPRLMAASFLWDLPITVTTAVQFFETLASNWPASLRKLHNLAGSAIFIDGAHAALPSHLWPQAWRWLQDLVKNWGCHIVLGSGSLARFWELPEFSENDVIVPEIAGEELYKKAIAMESNRVTYPPPIDEPMGLDELCTWVMTLQGPRIVVMNTVQSAAALARKLSNVRGFMAVEHISTALTSGHRATTLDRVKTRLMDKDNKDWTLVATSCAEAGLDFSFRTAAREICSLASLIQIAGRVNRQCEYGTDCEVWSFRTKDDVFLKTHPAFKTSSRVLLQLYNNHRVNPESCTEAMKKEVRERNGGMAKDDPIVIAEKAGKFPEVAELFKVIDEGEVFTVVIDPNLKDRIEASEKPSREDIQKHTVRMRITLIRALGLSNIGGYEEIFYCYPEYYDEFIGYMKGILQVISTSNNVSIL
jgi:CRISPR-associated endonuclease/helicase Cas3